MKEALLLFWLTYHAPTVICGECDNRTFYIDAAFSSFQSKLSVTGNAKGGDCGQFFTQDEIFDTCDLTIQINNMTCEPMKTTSEGNQEMLCYYTKER